MGSAKFHSDHNTARSSSSKDVRASYLLRLPTPLHNAHQGSRSLPPPASGLRFAIDAGGSGNLPSGSGREIRD
jgi:hypothetical protein